MSEPFVDEQDEELLAQARQGDPEAFCTLAQKHEARLFQQSLALCGNPATAEDLAADTLIESWKSLGRFDGSCRFSTWLYAILLRHRKLVRKLHPQPLPLSRLPVPEAGERVDMLERLPDTEAAAAEAAARAEAAERLREAVAP